MRQATSKNAFLTKPRFSVSANVDFDGDGHIDTAQMVNNSRQGAVFVTFGGPNRRAPALAFKIDRPFTGGAEIRAAGRHRILLTLPDVSEHLIFMDRSGPKVTVGRASGNESECQHVYITVVGVTLIKNNKKNRR